MSNYIYWRGQRFTTGKSGKCPVCGHRTVCWEHRYMVLGYADFIRHIRKETKLGKN